MAWRTAVPGDDPTSQPYVATSPPGAEFSAPIPLGGAGETPRWRVLLRSAELSALARAGTQAARLAARTRGLKAQVEVDPEEV